MTSQYLQMQSLSRGTHEVHAHRDSLRPMDSLALCPSSAMLSRSSARPSFRSALLVSTCGCSDRV